MKKIAPCFLLVALLCISAFAQNASKDKDALSGTFLSGKHVKYSRVAPGGPSCRK